MVDDVESPSSVWRIDASGTLVQPYIHALIFFGLA